MESMKAFTDNNTEIKNEEKEYQDISGLDVQEYLTNIPNKSFTDVLKEKGFNGICRISNITGGKTAIFTLSQLLFPNKQIKVRLKDEDTLKDCTVLAKAGEDNNKVSTNAKVYIGEDKIRLADIKEIFVDLDSDITPSIVREREKIKAKLSELDLNNIDTKIQELVLEAVKKDLDYKYVATINPKFKFLNLVIPALAKDIKITEILSDKVEYSKPLEELLLRVIKQAPSMLKELDYSRPVNLLTVDFACHTSGFKLYSVYEKDDDFKTAYDKLNKAVIEKTRRRYYLSFDKRNTSFVEFPVDIFEKFVKVSATFQGVEGKKNGEKKVLDIRDIMIGNNLIGIYKLPISVEDLVNNVQLFDTLDMNKSCLVSTSKSPIMLRNLSIVDGVLYAGNSKVEGAEDMYIECLPATSNQIKKANEVCEKVGITTERQIITADMITEYANEYRKNDGLYLSFASILRDKGYTGFIDLNLNAPKEDLAIACHNGFGIVKFYDKEYGFREFDTELITTQGKSGDHSLKIKVGDVSVSASKFVRIRFNTEREQSNNMMKKDLMNKYMESKKK